MSTELIFGYIEFLWGKKWVSVQKIVGRWGSYSQKQGNILQSFEITHSFTIIFKYIDISELFIIWLLTMVDHPPTSIYIEPERQYDESMVGSLKSNFFTPQKKNSQFNHQMT